ncbi:DNA repair protein XRCC3 isoform X1 [Gymnogyps californianus]|uniref:DNA repair protein XRCC3 isoform X1 n=1 Tax=Gymnogyps californianus TaxID=33616 RepID=UPI0021C92007|nr:DNA repair protein XRCC3 isoform X1 [Gymnogyps californianus]
MDWDQFDLNPKVIAALKKADIKSVKEVLNLSGADLQRLMKLSSADIQCLQKTVSLTLRKNSMLTALQLYQDKDHLTSQHQKLSLGCSVLDTLLKGGIPLVGITELAGESSAGKTQISLQLCLCVQYPYKYGGLESGAVYICTEDVFPSKRLQQLIDQQHKLRADVPAEIVQKIKFGNSIFVEHAADLDTFHNCITKRISLLLTRGMVRLVVIDSIAALFRCEFGVSDSVMKARYLQTFGAQLHSLSTRFRTPIMCINQVTDAVSESEAAQCGCSNTLQGYSSHRFLWKRAAGKQKGKVLASCMLGQLELSGRRLLRGQPSMTQETQEDRDCVTASGRFLRATGAVTA